MGSQLDRLWRNFIFGLGVLFSKGPNALAADFKERYTRSRIKDLDRIYYFAKEHAVSFHDEIYKNLANGVLYAHQMGVPGDIAEFGTMTGRSAMAICAAFNESVVSMGSDSNSRKLHFFDSFEGLPEARFDVDKDSPHVTSGIWGKGTCVGLSADEFAEAVGRVVPRQSYEVYEGWFNESVRRIKPGTKFAMIHIDGDLYESAIDVLDFLFAKGMISEGALIFFDDFDCNAGNPNRGERLAWAEVTERYSVKSSDRGTYALACRCFLVHSYRQSF